MMTDLPQTLSPSSAKFRKLKDWTHKMKEVKLKEWTYKMKEWEIIPYLLRKNYITYIILPPSTTMTKEPIDSPWDGATWLLVPMTCIMLPKPGSIFSMTLLTFLYSLHQPTSSQMLQKIEQKERLQYKNNCNSFITADFSIQRSLATSLVNN